MEIFWSILFVCWCFGWIREVACVDAGIKRHGIKYPNQYVKNLMPIVLFFTWPYFYFYGKA